MTNKNLILKASGVSIVFGGLRAVGDFSCELRRGELVGLIGPNGAGKTTLFNMLSGVYTPSSGEITFWDKHESVKSIGKKTPAGLNRIGIARTFQNIRLFGNLSVKENVLIALHSSRRENPVDALLRLPRFRKDEFEMNIRAEELLALFAIDRKKNDRAKNLPYGEQRKLEIVRALASNPSLLLLDEPAAGMNPQETTDLMRLIRTIRKDFHITILLIEHDMHLVMGICERLIVLDYGRIIAEGLPSEVKNNPAVIKAYLGDIDTIENQESKEKKRGDAPLAPASSLAELPAVASATPRDDPQIDCEHPALVSPDSLLSVKNLEIAYGNIEALHNVSFDVKKGEIITLIGANGAGKTTILHGISGIIWKNQGSVSFNGKSITNLSPDRIVSLGLAQVPEGRRIFANLSVKDNLEMGAFTRKDGAIKNDLEMVYGLFPRLKERMKQMAGTLSGGEQQMLAMARALMARPVLLLLDEPSMGLAPILVDEIFAIIKRINAAGTTILLVEQNAYQALNIADRAYILETGSIVKSGPAALLVKDPSIREAYLG
jgi:branched-chain amino acid transport system ATP-binding protein